MKCLELWLAHDKHSINVSFVIAIYEFPIINNILDYAFWD